MSPDEYCQQKAAASGSSFYYSFLFLPQERRRAITALYAYCREVDDIVDEMQEAGVAQARLAWWTEEIGRLYAASRSTQSPARCCRIWRPSTSAARASCSCSRACNGSAAEPLPRLRHT